MPNKLTKEIVNERIAHRGIAMTGDYINNSTNTEFTCSDGHSWNAKPRDVIRGNGCPHCAGNFPLTKEIVNERIADRGIAMTGDYINAKIKTEFTCSDGHSWDATPDSVVRGRGCPHCADRVPLTKEIVNERIANRGIAMTGDYINVNTKTEFNCSDGHVWDAVPSSVMAGRGCPDCATSGFDPSNPAIMYYLRVTPHNADALYKIGITNRTVEDRFSNDELDKIDVVRTWGFDTGSEARDCEANILAKYGGHKYTGDNVLDSGNTELFTRDVMGLDVAD